MTKRCRICKQEKLDSEFYPNSHTKDGLRAECKECKRLEYQQNKEQRSKKAKENYWKNPQIARERANKYRKAFPNKVKSTKLMQEFGLSYEEYVSKLEAQNYSCAICDKHESNFTFKLAVDHDHESGKIRGLLCSNCNNGLGRFHDDLNKLQNAIEYLKKHQKIG